MVLLAGVAAFLLVAYLLWPAPGYGKDKIRKPDTTLPNDTAVDFRAQVEAHCPATGDHYLVVGAGFLGSKIIHALLVRGETRISAFDISGRALAPELQEHPHVTFIQGDVTKVEDLREACRGVDTVFSTFAVIRYFERLPSYAPLSEGINVGGTDNLLTACLTQGVKRLVQTSTSNVCAAKGLVHLEMTEESPYVTTANSPNHYGWTKAVAEQHVLRSHGKAWDSGEGVLHTTSVRPCSGIFGRRDNLNMERIFRDGKVFMLVPRTYLDWVFVDNVVWGHLLVEKGMQDGRAEVGGEVFCVGNNEPMTSEDFFHTVKTFLPSLKIGYIPYRLVRVWAYALEMCQRIMPSRLTPERLGEVATLSPATIGTCLTYAFSTRKAADVLGYVPLYSVDQGIQKSIREYEAGVLLPTLEDTERLS